MPENSTDAPTQSGGVSRRSILTGTLAGLMAPTAALALGSDSAAAVSSAALGTTRHITVYAEALPGGQYGYGLTPGKATIPGPVLEMWEGDTLQVELVNTTDKRLSIHPHGVDYATDSDGSPFNDSFNEPGETRTYVWKSHKPKQRADGTWMAGSAGYWHYHDHVVGTEHGTGGIRKGLYGPVIVRRKGDVLPDATHTIVFNDMLINNKPAHSGPDFEATVGDRVEFVMITHGEYYHTFHLHGHRWADNRTGMLTGPDDPSQVIDNKIVGPADSFGFQVIAGEGVGAGAWMYHCHVQSHSDMGMVGLFLVKKTDGTIPGYEPHEHTEHRAGHAH